VWAISAAVFYTGTPPVQITLHHPCKYHAVVFTNFTDEQIRAAVTDSEIPDWFEDRCAQAREDHAEFSTRLSKTANEEEWQELWKRYWDEQKNPMYAGALKKFHEEKSRVILETWVTAGAFAVIPPLVVLALVAALLWALRGFRNAGS
jgi:hypothetical protein